MKKSRVDTLCQLRVPSYTHPEFPKVQLLYDWNVFRVLYLIVFVVIIICVNPSEASKTLPTFTNPTSIASTFYWYEFYQRLSCILFFLMLYSIPFEHIIKFALDPSLDKLGLKACSPVEKLAPLSWERKGPQSPINAPGFVFQSTGGREGGSERDLSRTCWCPRGTVLLHRPAINPMWSSFQPSFIWGTLAQPSLSRLLVSPCARQLPGLSWPRNLSRKYRESIDGWESGCMRWRAKVAVFGEAVSGQVHDLFVGRSRLESWSIRSSFGDFGSTYSVRVLWKLNNRTSYDRRQPCESGAEVCVYRHLLNSPCIL